MSDHYVLKVLHADLTELWKKRPFHLFFKRDPSICVKIEVKGMTHRTCVQNSVTPTWNESFPLHMASSDASTVIIIKICHAMKSDFHIGYGQLNLGVGHSDQKIQLILSRDKKKKSTSSASITIQLQSSSVLKNTELALKNLVREATGPDVDLEAIIQEGKEILRSELTKNGIDCVGDVVKLIDGVAEVHPIVKLGWGMLSMLYKLASQQVKLDRKIRVFIKELLDLFIVVRGVSSISCETRQKAAFFGKVIDDLLEFIAECSLFIQGYIRRSFLGRTLRQYEKLMIIQCEERMETLKENLEISIKVLTLKLLEENTRKVDQVWNEMPVCLPGTRQKVKQEISDWFSSTRSSNLLLLLGIAGTGKSTIANTIIREYSVLNRNVSYLFFTRGKSDPVSIFDAIANDLAMKIDAVSVYINSARRNNKDPDPTLEEKFEYLLRVPLNSAVSSGFTDPVLIVLDALDEYSTPEKRKPLIKILLTRLSSLPSNFRFLVTGRPLKDIIHSQALPNAHIITLDPHSEESRNDILAYIRHRFEEHKDGGKTELFEDWPGEQVIQTLASNAGGLFIWASTAVTHVISRSELIVTRENRKECLERIVDDTKKLNMDELYETVLKTSFDWSNKEVVHLFPSVFSLILFGKTPLSDHEIDCILEFARGTTEGLLYYSRSIIIYEPRQPIRIQHASFYDYLVSCKGKSWYIDKNVQMAEIARKCFDKMEEFLKFNICNLESSYVLNTQIADLHDRIRRCIPPFLQYVCRNWAFHLQESPFSEELCNQLRVFVKEHILFWFEVLSLTDTFNYHVGAALLRAIMWLADKDQELSTFLRDAYQQATIFSDSISQSAPQIYSSLLPLTKADSVFSKHYAAYASPGVQIKYDGEKRRSACIKTIKNNSRSDFLSVSFSPDGTRVVSGSKDGTICVWDATSGMMILELSEKNWGAVQSVTFSPKGDLIASGSDDGVTRLWYSSSGGLFLELESDRGRVKSVVFSPCGKLVAMGYSDSTVQIGDVTCKSGVCKDAFEGNEAINSISFSHDGLYLASGSHDGKITLWKIGKNSTTTIDGHWSSVTSVAFSPDGTNIVSGSSDGTVRVWNVLTRSQTRIYEHDTKQCGSVTSVAYSPNGTYILAGGDKGTIELWDMSSHVNEPKRFEGITSCESLSFSPDGTYFASAHVGGAIKIWNVTGGIVDNDKYKGEGWILSISVSRSGHYIASANQGGDVCVWDSSSGQLAFGPFRGGRAVAFSPKDDTHLAYSSHDDIVLRNLVDGELTTLKGHTGPVISIAFSPCGKHVASGSKDYTIRVWDVELGELVLGPLCANRVILSVAYSPYSEKIVSGLDDATIQIWDATDNGRLLATLKGHNKSVNSVAYSHNGDFIVSGASDNTIRVWDAESGVTKYVMNHKNAVSSVCFSPKDERILSGSYDNTLCVWDSSTGKQELGPIKGHTGWITSVVFFPDGRSFASGSRDRTVRIWRWGDVIWQLRKDGWIISEDDKLLMWIPPEFRATLTTPRNPIIMNAPFTTNTDFNGCMTGKEWTKPLALLST